MTYLSDIVIQEDTKEEHLAAETQKCDICGCTTKEGGYYIMPYSICTKISCLEITLERLDKI